ncbi:unnamed protein product [Lactuca saligna]|uniref:Nucleoplasmin-like domain-containing protein n=1 Tax=Lactuca saligna TaxID=75948 RepID=A0AA35YXU8_LACSI|nr:unnamed protein product [Lactuca saligna]
MNPIIRPSKTFWGIELQSGESFDVNLEDKFLRLTLVSLIEIENETPDFISLHITENGKKRVFARLHPKRRPQLPLDVVYGQSWLFWLLDQFVITFSKDDTSSDMMMRITMIPHDENKDTTKQYQKNRLNVSASMSLHKCRSSMS